MSQPSASFIDAFSKRGPWREAADAPELHSWDNEVLLADGRRLHAVYMGAFWWAEGARIEPLGWRKVVNAGMAAGGNAKAD